MSCTTTSPTDLVKHRPADQRRTGKLYWTQEAYTVSDHFPYSSPHTAGFGEGLNYIRNSVKVVVDMYDGTVRF